MTNSVWCTAYKREVELGWYAPNSCANSTATVWPIGLTLTLTLSFCVVVQCRAGGRGAGSLYIHICVYMYMYMCIHTHTHTYILYTSNPFIRVNPTPFMIWLVYSTGQEGEVQGLFVYIYVYTCICICVYTRTHTHIYCIHPTLSFGLTLTFSCFVGCSVRGRRERCRVSSGWRIRWPTTRTVRI